MWKVYGKTESGKVLCAEYVGFGLKRVINTFISHFPRVEIMKIERGW